MTYDSNKLQPWDDEERLSKVLSFRYPRASHSGLPDEYREDLDQGN